MADYPADVMERIKALPCRPCVQWNRERLLAGIEDYLWVGGDQMSAPQAAQRLGVTQRTIERWRSVLRAVTQDSTGMDVAS
jgi:hypothetical protein